MVSRFNELFVRLMDEISARSGLDLAPGDDGVVTLMLDDITLSVESQPDSAHVYFHSPVRRLSSTPLVDLEAAMRLNLFRQDLSGSWLALDQDSSEILLCYSAQLENLSADKFLAMIEALAESVRSLRRDDRVETEVFDPPSADIQNFLRV